MPVDKIFFKNIGRWLLAALFLLAGVMHFASPGPFVRIVPPFLPWPAALVAISGAAEIAGALGLLTMKWRRLAAYGLVALLIAVFPANIYMAVNHMMAPAWALWARLPLQFLLIWWVLSVR
jgi:uncharacterized membrane protein